MTRRLTQGQVREGYVPGHTWDDVPVPEAFVLVGTGSGRDGRDTLTVDAYAMRLPDGNVVSFCACGECVPRIQMWPSWQDAADWHGSQAIWPSGEVTEPEVP